MRLFRPNHFLPAAFAVVLILDSSAQAGPNPPRERSFRPVVPIKQNVRGGFDQMRTQTVRLTIPPPPIPDIPAIPAPATEPAPETTVEPATEAPKEVAKSDLPPEAKPSSAKEGESSTPAAEDTEETEAPGGSKTPGSNEDAETPGETKESKATGPTLSQLRAEAHALAGKKLRYVFGADDPDTGGLDCSSTIQYLLTNIGIKDCPRTSYDQYDWLKRKKLLDDVYGKGASSKLLRKLSPGDLIFWGGTWKSGHRVSHVMLYMGYDPKEDKHYVFGARSKSTTGLTGAGVDIFELNTESGRLVAHGKIPGLVYE